MMIRYVQILAWIIKSTSTYFLLKEACRFQERRLWMIVIRVLMNAMFSLSIWTIHSYPFFIGWLMQIFWDMLMISDLRRKESKGVIFWRHLVYVATIESSWLLGSCIFGGWTSSLFSVEGNPMDALLGMTCSIFVSALQFLGMMRFNHNGFNRQISFLVIGMMTLNVLSVQIFDTIGIDSIYFYLVIVLYSFILIVAVQFLNNKEQLQKKEVELQATEQAIAKANVKIEDQTNQLREIRHSLKDHMRIIQLLNRQNRNEEVDRYLSELIGECNVNEFKYYCQDIVLNGLFNQMVASYPKIHFDILVDSNVDKIPTEFVEAIFLAIDNAIDELERHQDLSKTITITLRLDQEKVIGTIRNPLSSVKSLQTEKTDFDHGIGLVRMKKLIHELDGTIQIDQDAYFVVTMTIPQK